MLRLLTISFFISILCALPNALCAQTIDTINTNQTTTELERYEVMINATLRTFREEEKKFIADSFDLVLAGKLPKDVIDRSYLWVRKNRSYKKYQFIYFEKVMRIYAAQVKATVPAFDYSSYNATGSTTFGSANLGSKTVAGVAVGSSTFGAKTFKGSVSRTESSKSSIFGRK